MNKTIENIITECEMVNDMKKSEYFVLVKSHEDPFPFYNNCLEAVKNGIFIGATKRIATDDGIFVGFFFESEEKLNMFRLKYT